MTAYREEKTNRVDAERAFSVCRVWGQGSFMHLCFESPGCRFRKAGYCIMCDYGAGRTITRQQAEKAIDDAMQDWPVSVERILLGSCGSIFDTTEIPVHVLDGILMKLKEYHIGNVIFESHCCTISRSILQKIRSFIPDAKISIEMGFESSNERVLTQYLHKYLNLQMLTETIDIIHEYQMNVILNVLLGVPGLAREEQIKDTIHSCHWAFDHGADEIVVFPINLKPGTELWNQYLEGRYVNPSHEMLLTVLRSLGIEKIGKVSVSWYGDRQERGQDLDIIGPRAERITEDKWMDFYASFMGNFDPVFRKLLIDRQYNALYGG